MMSRNENKRKSVAEGMLSTPEKKAVGIKRERMDEGTSAGAGAGVGGLAAPSPSPTPAPKRTAAVGGTTLDPGVRGVPLMVGTISGSAWASESASDSDSDSVGGAIIMAPVGEPVHSKKDWVDCCDSDVRESRYWEDSIKSNYVGMTKLYAGITGDQEARMTGFLLEIMSNLVGKKPSDIVRLLCGVGEKDADEGMKEIEDTVRQVWWQSEHGGELNDEIAYQQRQVGRVKEELRDLEEEHVDMAEELDKTTRELAEAKEEIKRLEVALKSTKLMVQDEKNLREWDRKNSGTRRMDRSGVRPQWRDVASQATPVGNGGGSEEGSLLSTVNPSYTSVATQSTPGPTGQRGRVGVLGLQ